MKIFKAEQWNLELLLPLFESYRRAHGMPENPERTLAFLNNRIRFSESIIFIATDKGRAVGFIQLYPRLSALRLQRYWQLTDIFVAEPANKPEIYSALIGKAKEFVCFTQSKRLVAEQEPGVVQQELWEGQGFKLNPQKSFFELSLG
ncbi:GNAT family N-acetyltransferase [Mesocricetibacter intestinalis]|nr:GNAT family N-acetyltransferase [Mesocricetibacter intestinalis]